MKIKEVITENVISNIWNKLKNGVVSFYKGVLNVFNKIGFGQSKEIHMKQFRSYTPVTEAPMNDRERMDLTSIIGYFNEFAVANKLAIILTKSGCNVSTESATSLEQTYINYKSYIEDNIDKFGAQAKKVPVEVQRAEDGSDVMAQKMYDEISQANDLKLIDVIINHTGIDAMGSGKEDIVVIIRKRDTQEVTDMIKASLKLYKTGGGINVYNATFASYINKVLLGDDDPGTGEKAIQSFLASHPDYKEKIEKVTAVTSQWNKIKTELKNKKDPEYRKAANAFITQNRGYQQLRDLMFEDMFKFFYEKDKAGINERILHRLGLDGADDVYLLVGTKKQKMVAVSSRTSEAFSKLYGELKKNFNIRFDIPSDPEIVSPTMVIESETGEDLAKFTISFKEGTTMPHMFNMNDIVDDARK